MNLGNILFESNLYDSSLFYLETVFEQQDDIQSRILAAENLFNICQIEGDSIKAQKYVSFLDGFTMSEIEKKRMFQESMKCSRTIWLKNKRSRPNWNEKKL